MARATKWKKLVDFKKNRIVMLGFGCVGTGVLPLILRHFDMKPDQMTIIAADKSGSDEARAVGVPMMINAITEKNYREVLSPLLSAGDFLVNLSVDVSSIALIELCQEKGIKYLDTCIEPWAGGYTDNRLSESERSNYGLREKALALRQSHKSGSTAVLTHGANPGLVSHFLKQALMNMAEDTGLQVAKPQSREEWADLASKLQIKAIHIAERDTQVANRPKLVNEFVNTWSVDGFFGEGCQPAELGWGVHEKHFPDDGRRHAFGCGSAIYLARSGYTTRVRSWTPLEGPYHGFLITHSEAISIADYFTVKQGDKVDYRPTVHYAYHPCDDAVLSVHELAGKNGEMQKTKRLMRDEIIRGMDELGVLLLGNPKGVYWYGSRMTIEEARKLAPYNSATSLQVTAGVLSAMVWACENPTAGVVEPDEMDFDRVLEVASPYLGEMVGVWGQWNPLQDRGKLFAEDMDETDPWQFKNIRVA